MDRLAAWSLSRAMEARSVVPGATLVAASLADFGISVAWAASAVQHPVHLLMPESVSLERRALLGAYGARVSWMAEGMSLSAMEQAAKTWTEANAPAVHLRVEREEAAGVWARTAGQEVLEDARAVGRADAWVCGIGTGATFAGIGGALAAAYPGMRQVIAWPSSVPHHLQGLSTDLPALQAADVRVAGACAWAERQRLARAEGCLVGLSSAANIWAARQVASALAEDAVVYTLAWSTGERDFSMARYFE